MSDARPHVLIAEPDGFSPGALAKLRGVAEVELREVAPNELHDALKSCAVFWFRLKHRLDATVLADARCRVIATAVTGLDHIDLDSCHALGITVVSLRGETAFLRDVRATAEHTIALTLALLRHIPEASTSVRDGNWDRAPFRGNELYRKTVGIVGLGRLGAIVAEYFRAFGMEVLACDPRPDFRTDLAKRVDLNHLLANSDIVSLHVAYNAETRSLIGARELARMRPHAVLVNTARGGVIDEIALANAIERRTIAGAALDVLDGEPGIDAAHALVRLAARDRRLLLTPHIGGNTFESFEKTESFLADRVIDALGLH